MRKIILVCSVSVMAISPALSAPWVRGYAVDKYEPAFYYGAKTPGTTDRGTDCPKGIIPEMDFKAALKTGWRSEAAITAAARRLDPSQSPVAAGGQGSAAPAAAGAETSARPINDGGLAARGFAPGINTYTNPFAAPDPGWQEVTGKIAEGFNLDGKAETGGFTDASGERGIDNNLYRVYGCALVFRGSPYLGYRSQYSTDHMRDGLYTMVIRISGNQSPMNDSDAVVEVAYSPDRLVKDTAGNVVADYSYRPFKGERYTKLKAVIKNGVVETEQVPELHMSDIASSETERGEAVFKKGRMRLTMQPDGRLSGLAGGYRDWLFMYLKDTFNQPINGGGAREQYTQQNQIGVYYSLKRNADGIPDPKTGQNTGISSAYRFTAVPAHVVDPDTPIAKIDEPPLNMDAQVSRALATRAIVTKELVAVPNGDSPGYGTRIPLPKDWDKPVTAVSDKDTVKPKGKSKVVTNSDTRTTVATR